MLKLNRKTDINSLINQITIYIQYKWIHQMPESSRNTAQIVHQWWKCTFKYVAVLNPDTLEYSRCDCEQITMMCCYSIIREVGLVLQTCVLMYSQKQKFIGVMSGEHSGHFTGPPYPIVCWPNSVGNTNGRLMHYMEEVHHVKTTSIWISKRQHFI